MRQMHSVSISGSSEKAKAFSIVSEVYPTARVLWYASGIG